MPIATRSHHGHGRIGASGWFVNLITTVTLGKGALCDEAYECLMIPAGNRWQRRRTDEPEVEMNTCGRIAFPTPASPDPLRYTPRRRLQCRTTIQRRRCCLLGTLLMALSGRSTRTVRMADRLMFWRSREYSTILCRGHKGIIRVCLEEKPQHTLSNRDWNKLSAKFTLFFFY